MKGVLSTGYMDTTEARLYYEVTGAGEAIVLIHSAATDHRIWDDQFEKFAKNYLVVRYDARGFGDSDLPGGAFSHADDLRDLLDFLDLDSARLVGLGEGGAVALDGALSQPERITGVVIAAPTLVRLAWSEAHQWTLDHLYDNGEFDAAQAVAELMGNPAFRPAQARDRAEQRLQRILLDNAHMIQVRSMARSGQANGLESLLPERLKQVSVPVLILVGEHDAEPYHAACRTMMTYIPGAAAATILDAGRFINVEQPEAFNRLALDFFAGLG